jgi:hypothetical protein
MRPLGRPKKRPAEVNYTPRTRLASSSECKWSNFQLSSDNQFFVVFGIPGIDISTNSSGFMINVSVIFRRAVYLLRFLGLISVLTPPVL